ncbi:MAG: WecB/TagA/CpsF family glycosyltransferase [bacterium]|nr:WecB/TagA/CpsF family glycosyltransferase [bacterium]
MRLLAVQLGDIGDLALTTPALGAIRERWPDAHMAVLTPPHAAPILEGTGLADDVIPFRRRALSGAALFRPAELRAAFALARRLRGGRYDAVIFFHSFTTRAGALKFAVLALAAGVQRRIGLQNGNGFFLTDSVPDHGFSEGRAAAWLRLVQRLGVQQVDPRARIGIADAPIPPKTAPFRIAIHAGSGGAPARRWHPAQFAAVADALHTRFQAEIVFLGGPGDDTSAVTAAMHTPYTDLTGMTTLAGLAGVLSACDLFIGADSGVMHIAAAVGTPIVALFGPSNPQAWSPHAPPSRLHIVRAGVACSPCMYVGHELGDLNGCAARTCMALITPAHVVSAASGLLDGQPPPAPAPIRQRPTDPPSLSILGIPVSRITYDGWMALIARWMTETDGALKHVCTVNPEMIMIARRDAIFRWILRRADLTVPDGVGLLWAAKRAGSPLPERVTGSDGVPRIAQEAAAHGWRLFLLGAAPGIAETAAARLTARHPTLKIAGTYAGSPAPEEEAAIVERINASGADLLFVAYGAPEQDKWIARNSPRLRVKMAMGIGGTLDFIAGAVPRAPGSFRRLGLEWLYRLILQPWRIRRMMRLPRFAAAVLLERRSTEPQTAARGQGHDAR